MLNLGAIIGHDVHVGEYSVICPGVHVAGWVSIGEGAFVGSNSCIHPKLHVGDWSRVAMGSAVYKSVEANCAVSGNPARIMRRYRAGWFKKDDLEATSLQPSASDSHE